MPLIEDSIKAEGILINKYAEYVDTLRKEYITDITKQQEREILYIENNIENRDVNGYHGREIFELLQNADDAYLKSIESGNVPSNELTVEIAYDGHTLRIANTGTAFDNDGIKAIVCGNASSKGNGYIGRKGTGFRSLLNWAEEIRIFSGGFNIRFSKEIAKRTLEELCKKGEEQILKQQKKYPDLKIPMLALPENIEPYKNTKEKTIIEIDIDTNKDNDIESQLLELDTNILLFMPNIKAVHISFPNFTIKYEKELYEENRVTITRYKDTDKLEKTFSVFTKKVELDSKIIELKIAVPKNKKDTSTTYLYSYFPLLDTVSPFNVVMHAPYISLSDQRNTINNNKKDREIIIKQLEFILEVAQMFIDKRDLVSAYNLILPKGFNDKDWKFPAGFEKFNVEKEYISLLMDMKMFETVNGDMISIKDSPTIISNGMTDFPNQLKGEHFCKLLKPISNVHFIALMKLLAKNAGIKIEIEEIELCNIISKASTTWSIADRVVVFDWWNSEYKNCLPELMKTQKGSFLNYKDICYLLAGDFKKNSIPEWVDVTYLDYDYQIELFKIANENKIVNTQQNTQHISRRICNSKAYNTVDFRYTDKSNFISLINSSVDSYEHSKEFIKWLWINFSGNTDWQPPKIDDKSYYLSYMDKRISSDYIYYGEDYGFELSKKLFSNKYIPFPNFSELDLLEDNKDSFITFFEKFGVKKYPEIVIKNVSVNDCFTSKYINEVRNVNKLSPNCPITLYLQYIPEIQQILESNETETIVKWIKKDTRLRFFLQNKYCATKISYFHYIWRTFEMEIENYLLWIFNVTPWIKIGGIRYAPKQIINAFKYPRNSVFCSQIPTLTKENLVEIAAAAQLSYEEVECIFDIFDICKNVTALDSQTFYTLMLNIPEMDLNESIKLSQAVFNSLENDTKRVFDDSNAKKEYLKRGKILVMYQGIRRFIPAKEAYCPSQKILNKYDTPIVDKNLRSNNEIFIKVLGCREYIKEYTLIPESVEISPFNEAFKRKFKMFKKYAIPFANQNTNLSKAFTSLNITLASALEVASKDSTENKRVTEEYYTIDNRSEWYIIVANDNNKYVLSQNIEAICEKIANTSGFDAGKIGEIFRCNNAEEMEFLVTKEFHTLDVINDEHYQNSIKLNFIDTLKNYYKGEICCEVENIDFNCFEEDKNAPIIISIFRSLSIDISDFKGKGFVYNIDLRPYYKRQLNQYKAKNAEKFRDMFFSKALNGSMPKEKFLEEYNLFLSFEPHIINSVTYNYELEVLERFGDPAKITPLSSANYAYNSNYTDMVKDNEYDEMLANDDQAKTYIYFGMKKEFD